MNVEILSRIQFAFTISFHYIYPPLSIGLGLIMVIMEAMYLKTKNFIYEKMTRFYTKIFSLIFGIGVATGIVMEFEFGTNWATYSKYVGDIFGSALSAEGIFAFALESGFLGILLFGWNKVNSFTHFFSTVMVTIGSMFSAIWIVIANSWQQTPSGFRIVGKGLNAKAEITNFWDMIFNPSSLDRILHVWLGSFIAGSFLVLSISSYYILNKKYIDFSYRSFRLSLIVATISCLSQFFSGHRSAKIVANYQPIKLAAMEGHYSTIAPADLYIFGYINSKKKQVKGLKIPHGLSFLLYQNFFYPIKGLKSFPKENQPGSLNLVFQTYHLMVCIGIFIILLTLYSCFLLWKKKLFKKKWLLQIFVWSVFLPELANQSGWFTAETGRQPWVVYGLLRTSDALSQSIKKYQVIFSLIIFTFIYTLLFILFIYLLYKKIKNGPYLENDIDHSPLHKIMGTQILK